LVGSSDVENEEEVHIGVGCLGIVHLCLYLFVHFILYEGDEIMVFLHNIIAFSFTDSISSSTPPSPTTTPSSSSLDEA